MEGKGTSGDGVVTSDDELLSVDAGVALGALQQGDPVVHLLGRVGVAVQHAVRRDHDEGVRPVMDHKQLMMMNQMLDIRGIKLWTYFKQI